MTSFPPDFGPQQEKIIGAMMEIDKLIRSWGIRSDDYFYMGREALRMLGFPVPLNDRGRVDTVLATREATLPWFEGNPKRGFQEVPPPQGSDHLVRVNAFTAQHGMEVHFYSFSEPKFSWREEYLGNVTLPNGTIVRFNGPYGVIRGLEEDMLPFCNDAGLGYEKGVRMLQYIRDIGELARDRGDERALQKARQVLKEFGWISEEYEKKLNEARAQEIVRGTSVVPGLVQGVAHLVQDILVNPPTTPSIVITEKITPAFYRYRELIQALVVDHGGITSHAAILAREWKIPTVISTKVAMHKFTTGDMIEVDATNGIVRKITSTP